MSEECSAARDIDASLTFVMFNVEEKRRQISTRSTAVPMDFEFTHRASSSIKPAWVSGDPLHAPQKRMTHRLSPLKSISTLLITANYEAENLPPSPFTPHSTVLERPLTPTNESHLFPAPGPRTPVPPQWQPPPPHVRNPEIVDVDMSEVSPNIPKAQQQPQEDSPSKLEKESRVLALGGIRRVFRSRLGKAASKQYNIDADDADEESVNSEVEEEKNDHEGRVMRLTQPATTNNHYTLNLASSAPTAKPDLPYTLSGSVLWSNPLAYC